MNREAQALVAEAFGAPASLVPLLPDLLEDFSALGAWPDYIVRLLSDHPVSLPRGATAVDLGCGKGAVALALATEFGWRVTGIDVFEPFLEAAAAAARAGGVERLCAFETGDIREGPVADQLFDVVVFSAVGAGLFGGYAECVAALRSWTQPGGYIVIGDGVLRHPLPPGTTFAGYEYYRGHNATLRQLTAYGDALVEELLISAEDLAAENRAYNQLFRQAVSRLADEHPEHRDQLQAFLTRQERECAFLEAHTTEALWLLRRV